MGAPQPAMSPARAAGRPPIKTVALPLAMGVGGCGPASGGIAHACMSPTTAAGMPPMRTVGTPGPVIVPGCPVGSPTLAAGGRFFSPLIPFQRVFNPPFVPKDLQFPPRFNVYLPAGQTDGRRLETD